MGDWIPWVIGGGMGALITYFYVTTVTTPQLAAGGTAATKTS